MMVELDIFSGRPNPRWKLTSHQVKEFNNQIEKLPESKLTSKREEGLGYRGMVIRSTHDIIHGYDEIVICKGVVIARRGKKSKILIDKDRTLERELLQTGRRLLDDDLYFDVLATIETD